MNHADIRKRAENHRAAAAREAAEARPLSPDDAFTAALSLLALDEAQNGSPFERDDPVTAHEDAEMWDAWTKLRARWPRER